MLRRVALIVFLAHASVTLSGCAFLAQIAGQLLVGLGQLFEKGGKAIIDAEKPKTPTALPSLAPVNRNDPLGGLNLPGGGKFNFPLGPTSTLPPPPRPRRVTTPKPDIPGAP